MREQVFDSFEFGPLDFDDPSGLLWSFNLDFSNGNGTLNFRLKIMTHLVIVINRYDQTGSVSPELMEYNNDCFVIFAISC